MTHAELLADQAIVFGDFPTEEVVIKGVSYQGLVMAFERGNDVIEGGLLDDYSFSVAIERSTIDGAKPSEGDKVKLRNEKFLIARVKEDDKAASITIFLKAASLR
jgi:hypothetical protein